jgi:hypothetical protein
MSNIRGTTALIPGASSGMVSPLLASLPLQDAISFSFTDRKAKSRRFVNRRGKERLPAIFAGKNAISSTNRSQAIGQFLDWCQRAGFSNIEDIEPIHVAAYIEQHSGSAATIKQHMAAIRMMFSWLTEKGILAINPAREVKTPKFSRTEGKTPAFSTEEVVCPDRCRRESEGRELLSNWETITDPLQRERRQGRGNPGPPQAGRDS